MGLFEVNTPNMDRNRIDRGVGGLRCTVQKMAYEVGVGLCSKRFAANMGYLAPDPSGNCNFIATVEATLFGCLDLNYGNVEVKGAHCCQRKVNW